uniref:Glutathione S-transferase n=2 Tax=Plutella xylostella TaxID=51655 RepID=X5CCB3_PLUXY|nr:glutathione S-transferase 1-like [Plutella xylostella]AHW45905.1 glutathione S-transferase [Plutella xylostella]
MSRHTINNMSKLLLYKVDGSPPSNSILMIAHLLNLDMDYKEPDLLRLEHRSPEFKKINPMGTIPVLKDGNFVLAESHSILKYIVEKYGGPQRSTLYPFDLQTRAAVDERMHFDTGVLFISLSSVVKASIFGDQPAVTPEQLASIESSYATLELYLERSRFVAADHLTIADFGVLSTTLALRHILPIDANKFPKISAWLSQLEEEAFVKNVGAPNMEKFKAILYSSWERNKSKMAR